MVLDLMKLDEVATRLKLHPATIRKAIRQGLLEASKFGRDYRISPIAVEEYIKRQIVVVKRDKLP